MIPALAPLFSGPLAGLGDGLVGPDDTRPARPGPTLTDEDTLAALLDRYGTTAFARPDRRAVASVWMKWHASIVVVPVVLAALLAGRRLPVALEEIAVILSADGRTEAVRLPNAGETVAGPEVAVLLRPLVRDHLTPLVDTVSRAGGLSPRVPWSNLSYGLQTMIQRLEKALGTDHPAVRGGKDLLAAAHWPGLGGNPLHAPAALETPFTPRRRTCCLRYRMDLPFCKACPLDRSPARKEPRP